MDLQSAIRRTIRLPSLEARSPSKTVLLSAQRRVNRTSSRGTSWSFEPAASNGGFLRKRSFLASAMLAYFRERLVGSVQTGFRDHSGGTGLQPRSLRPTERRYQATIFGLGRTIGAACDILQSLAIENGDQAAC